MEDKKYKGALCKNCGADFLVAAMPEAEYNQDSIRDFSRLAKEGFEIVIRPMSEMNFTCNCPSEYDEEEEEIDDDTWDDEADLKLAGTYHAHLISITYSAHTLMDELAMQELQELIDRLGPEGVLAYIKQNQAVA